MCLLLWAVGWGSVLETGSHLRGVPHAWGRKRSRVSQHTSCELSPGRLPPRTKAVLQPASSRAMARHGWSQAWGAALPRALARLLRCCPSPPAQQPPHGRQAPGKCGTGPWGHSLTSCRQCCSVWVPSLPTYLLPVLAREQHRSPRNTWPSGGGGKQGGQGPWPPTLAPRFHHRCCSHSERRTERCLRHSTASQPGLVSSRHSTARGRGAVTSRLCDAGWRLPAGCSSCDALHRGRCLHHSNAEQWNGLGRKGQ